MSITRRNLSKKRKQMTLRDKRKKNYKMRAGATTIKSSIKPTSSENWENDFGFSNEKNRGSQLVKQLTKSNRPKTLLRTELQKPVSSTKISSKKQFSEYGFPPDKELKYSVVMNHILIILKQSVANTKNDLNNIKKKLNTTKKKSFLKSFKKENVENVEIQNISKMIEQLEELLKEYEVNYLNNKKKSGDNEKDRWVPMTKDEDYYAAIDNVLYVFLSTYCKIFSLIEKIKPINQTLKKLPNVKKLVIGGPMILK